MKNHKFLFVFVGLILTTSLFSQQNFVPGYIIQQGGDTLKGFIDYRNWAKNPAKIKFKKTEQAAVNEYKPFDILGFAVKDEIYKSAVVKVDDSNVERMSNSAVFQFRTDTVFLQTRFQGSKSLYAYKDKNGQENFYIYADSAFQLLEYKKYYNNDKEITYWAYNNRFLGQLSLYLADCKGIESKLNKVKYSGKSLEDLFLFYYSHKSTKDLTKNKSCERIRVETGVVGGMSLLTLKFSSPPSVEAFNFLTRPHFENKLSFTGGLFLNIVIPRNNGKWSSYNEMLYQSAVSHAYYNNYTNAHIYQNHDMTIGCHYLKVNNMIRYKYPLGKAFVFVNAGMSNGFSIIQVNRDVVENRFGQEIIILDQKVLDDLRMHEQGLIAGAGFIYNRFTAELRCEVGNGMSVYSLLSSKANRYQLLFSYRF